MGGAVRAQWHARAACGLAALALLLALRAQLADLPLRSGRRRNAAAAAAAAAGAIRRCWGSARRADAIPSRVRASPTARCPSSPMAPSTRRRTTARHWASCVLRWPALPLWRHALASAAMRPAPRVCGGCQARGRARRARQARAARDGFDGRIGNAVCANGLRRPRGGRRCWSWRRVPLCRGAPHLRPRLAGARGKEYALR